MKKIRTLLAVTSLCVASVSAQTVSDDFNDNSRDAALWEDPELDAGVGGKLDEVNSRLEFDAPSAVENFVFQEAKLYPTYNQTWQATMIVSLNKVDFGSGGIGFMVLEAGSNTVGDNYVAVGNGAGFLPGEVANSQAVVTDGGDSTTEDNLQMFATAVPQAFGVKVAYDPRSRTIRTFYDLDTDQTDGEWTLLKSYTIDGSSAPVGGLSLDWGMSANDTFRIQLSGGSENVEVSIGNAWFDDFEFVPGSTISAPTFADDFDDNVRDTVIWGTPNPDANEELNEVNQRLEFTSPAGPETWVVQGVNSSPNYDQAWQVQALIRLDQSKFGANQLGYMGIEIGGSSSGEKGVDMGMAVGNAPDLGTFPFREVIFTGGYDPILTEDGGFLNFYKDTDLIEAIGVRATYDPNTRIIRVYYDLNGDNSDGEWTLFESYTIDNSTVAGTKKLNWGMTEFDTFYLGVYGGAEGNVTVTSGDAWMDDFQFNQGPTLQATAPLSFSDDFNDDSIDANWNDPNIVEGTPVFEELNHRTELTSASAAGTHELSRSINPLFWPSYSQAFELKVEAHCLPGGVDSDGELALAELMVANNSGEQDILVSIGVLHDAGVPKQLKFSDNSDVEPLNDFPESFDLGITLPEVVGLRMVWDPETKIMSCYFDTDGDRSVETWVLYTTYTLDNSNQGTTHISDWGMTSNDQFRIGISSVAENTALSAGEIYFDNFLLFNAPLTPALTGYELWASAILDENMRGQTDDASGNGIPNLLQYMYGLEPLAADTDVKLRIQMNGATPELIHGFNTAATDYIVDYLEKLAMSDGWSNGFIPNSIDTFEANGKTFRRVTLPSAVGNEFLQLEIIPQF